MRLPVSDVDEVVGAALAVAGVVPGPARIQADSLLEAELRGHPSHGLLRLPRIVERIGNGVSAPNATGRHEWTTTAALVVDGERGLGPVVAASALTAVCERARNTGVAVARVGNCNHLGMLSAYVERIARGGQAAIAFTTSEALVHPWGGRRAMLGTNPLAIGVPAQPEPFVLDMATSAVSMGRIHDYAARGQALEPGWASDIDGAPTTDAARAVTGSISPFGGPKGYGLGLGIELLVGALTASALGPEVKGTLDSTEVCNKGDLFVVFDLGDRPGIAEELGRYLDEVRASPGAVGSVVGVPGDRMRTHRERALAEGIDVPDPLWERLRELTRTTA